MNVHREQRPMTETFFIAVALLLLFATSFVPPLVIMPLSVVVLVAGSVILPHLRQRGLLAAGLAFLAAIVLVRLAYSLP